MRTSAFSCLLVSIAFATLSGAESKDGYHLNRTKERASLKSSTNAEEARWMVNVGEWGVVSYTDPKDETRPLSMVASFADLNGRIFFYLMGDHNEGAVTLTVSEASLKPTSNFAGAACGEDGDKDPEDPRCAKLSIEGSLNPCENELICTTGKQALFQRHPEMEQWPADHGFTVHELKPNDVWMIANYGGGGTIDVKDYQTVKPKHHPRDGRLANELEKESKVSEGDNLESFQDEDVPDWDKKVERARWVVAHSLWTTVSTISVRLDSAAWGNIRSIVDGGSYVESSGKPVFYLPSPDPTSVDVQSNPTISLLFSEAAIAERVEDDKVCAGRDAMDPLCARVLISGKAIQVNSDQLKNLEDAFGKRHPLAPWLSGGGGAHTGGAYYTIEPDQISILDYYGGATDISVIEYLAWTVPSMEKKQLRGSIDIA